MAEYVHDDEQLDDLQLAGLKIIQKKSGFRFTMDSVLLADFARISARSIVADLGSGTGIITLLLIGRNKGKQFHCIEIQPEIAEMSLRTMQMNGLDKMVSVHCCDICNGHDYVRDGSVNAVVMNPPYGLPGTAIKCPDDSRNYARNLPAESLTPWFRAAHRMLAGSGRVFAVFPASRMLDIFDIMRNSHIEPKRIRLVHTHAGSKARLVMVEGAKDGRPMLEIDPPLIVYNEGGAFTQELIDIYHIKEVEE